LSASYLHSHGYILTFSMVLTNTGCPEHRNNLWRCFLASEALDLTQEPQEKNLTRECSVPTVGRNAE
jgi:hypothetical protein